MLIGYVRVSTNDQNTALQRNALESAGCELIFEDKISGKVSDRTGLKKVLRTLSEGDTLVVWKLDRLGRSMRHLVVLVEELREKGVNFRSLTDSIDTSTPMGRLIKGGMDRKQVAIIYDVGLSTLYKKFPVSICEVGN
ncbi:TPA: recombinase family protein [Citrobacter freundii]|uniref:recombinase family protein n=1 Tax=Citrobacter freundii TaxID=546 RepID=UPI0015E97054|nr:recombinase family protein [Citrobacter freundii]QLX35647.1 recombinase family protein [Citrobacter freundii]HED2194114.1 recombinase family protein [Citrobacter freundii]